MQLSRRLTSLTSRTVAQYERFPQQSCRNLATETSSDTVAPIQASASANPSSNDGVEAEDEALPVIGPPQRYSRWINEKTQEVIGGESGCETIERYRRANQSLPRLEGQIVKAHVLAVDQHCVVLDPGYQATQTFFKSELQNVPVYAKDGTRLGIPESFQVGDILHVKIDMLQTPFGDMQLSLGGKLTQEEQVDRVLEELKRAQISKKLVMGRILNPVNRGYAVGIGGLVCFCPITQCLWETAQRVGVLQPFTVSQMKMETRNVVIYDAAKNNSMMFRNPSSAWQSNR